MIKTTEFIKLHEGKAHSANPYLIENIHSRVIVQKDFYQLCTYSCQLFSILATQFY
jgi:hypothetical protein